MHNTATAFDRRIREQEAAGLLGVSTKTIQKYATQGEL
jgi:predicted site-specific integrase-resolvase